MSKELLSKEKTTMENKNMMKIYLGAQYTNNHLRNFCLYWLKAAEGSGNEWRKKNDLDCLYFNGDLRADTLMSAWTPIKWVLQCLNKEYHICFYKTPKYLQLLAEDRDAYLPPKHELVKLLDEFLTLAEQRCNYILLPDGKMNRERYQLTLKETRVKLYDEVPATLYYIFERDALGRFFKDEIKQNYTLTFKGAETLTVPNISARGAPTPYKP